MKKTVNRLTIFTSKFVGRYFRPSINPALPIL